MCFQLQCSQPGCFWHLEQGKSSPCRKKSFIAARSAFPIPSLNARVRMRWGGRVFMTTNPPPTALPHISHEHETSHLAGNTSPRSEPPIHAFIICLVSQEREPLWQGPFLSCSLLYPLSQTIAWPEHTLDTYSLNAHGRWGSFWCFKEVRR